MKNVCHTGNNNDNNYASLPSSLAALADFSDSEPVIPFDFGVQESVTTAAGYPKIVFAVFARGYLLVLMGFSS